MASSPEFPTRQEILQYRTLTTLLARTDVVETSDEPERGRYRAQSTSPGLWEYLNDFVNLLVRDTEIVAILPCGPSNTLPADVTLVKDVLASHDQEAERLDEWVVSKNFARRDSPKDKLKGPFPKLNVKLLVGSSAILDNGNPAHKVFLEHQPLTFEDNCDVALRLLKENHRSTSNQQRISTALAFRIWVVLSTCRKMKKRIKAGQQNSNIWESLTSLDEREVETDFESLLPNSLDDEQFPTTSQKSLMKMLVGHAYSKDTEPNQPFFDAHGRTWLRCALREILSRLESSLQDLVELLAATRVQTYSAEDENALDVETELAQSVLAVLTPLKCLYKLRSDCDVQLEKTLKWIKKINNLRVSTVPPISSKTGPGDPPIPDASSSTDPLASSVTGSSPIKKSNVIKSPLSTNQSSPLKPQSSVGASSVRQQSGYAEEESSPAVPDEAVDDDEDKNDLLTETTIRLGEIAIGMKNKRSMSNNEDAPNDESMSIAQLIIDDAKKGWVRAASRFIKLLCIPFEATESLVVSPQTKRSLPEQVAATAYVSKASLKVVDVMPNAFDQHMQPYDDCLQEMIPDHEKRKTIEDWMTRLKVLPNRTEVQWRNPSWKGSWHCEMVLLGIHALSLPVEPDYRSAPSIQGLQQVLKDVADVPSKVIEILKNRGRVLTVSKRCCPSCKSLAEMINEEGQRFGNGQRLDYPGNHVAWSPVSMPPWLPKRYATALLHQARATLQNRLDRIHMLLEKQMNERKRSVSHASVGPDPESTHPTKLRKIDQDKRAETDIDEEEEQWMREDEEALEYLGLTGAVAGERRKREH